MTQRSIERASNGSLGISVGMCAFNEERNISAALASLVTQELPEPLVLREILVVVSGCTDRTEEVVQGWRDRDPRIVLLRESRRTGKSRALSWFLREAKGEILVNLNADARLANGALASLLTPFARSPQVKIACGAPHVPNGASSPVLCLVDLLWRLHNRTLETLSKLGLPNHCCDEFMAFRRGFVDELPDGLMNDGAYLGALAATRGSSVLFSPAARVFIDPPKTLAGYIRRRQTLLRGHRQVTEFLRQPPNTLKGLARGLPALAAGIVVREVLANFRSMFTGFLLLFPLEIVATFIAELERLSGRHYEPIWTPVD